MRLAGVGAAGAGLPSLMRAEEALRISILHTTDLHGHILPTTGYDGQRNVGGLARCATQIGKWRAENPNSLLIDAGDIYQGTDVALRTRGELMIDLFNLLRYDAWVVGNHEFDWGFEPFARAIERSAMPVLGANIFDGSTPVSAVREPRVNCEPFIMKRFGPVNIAVVGITTPGMQFWFLPEFTGGLEFKQPVEPVRRAIALARDQGADAIVLAGHMGLKDRTGGDDFANSVIALTNEFPDVVAFIAGHTHQPIESRLSRGVLFTQADHFGIHAGKLDLWFERDTKKLLKREARCELMDERVELDAAVISRSSGAIAESELELNRPIGELIEPLGIRGLEGAPSDVERLIGTAVIESLRERRVEVSGVMHGLFDDTADMVAGRVAIRDVWDVLPYENFVVTAELTCGELEAVMQEIHQVHERRSLLGFEVKITGRGVDARATVRPREGSDAAHRYAVAFNTFDARSAGHRFMRLRALLERPEARRTLHQLQTRDALIAFFQRHKEVGKQQLLFAGGRAPM